MLAGAATGGAIINNGRAYGNSTAINPTHNNGVVFSNGHGGGLIGEVNNSTVENSRTERIYVAFHLANSQRNTGGLVGFLRNSGRLRNSSTYRNIIRERVNSSSGRYGDHVGENSGGSVSGNWDTGTRWFNARGNQVSNTRLVGNPGACFTAGSLITLYDGTMRPVEQLTGEEYLLAWDFTKGGFTAARILFVESLDLRYFEIIHLFFCDGTDVKVIYHHAFWNFDLNSYSLFTASSAENYIGHRFKRHNNDLSGFMAVTLINVEIYFKYTTAWSPVTVTHLNFYVNSLITMPGATSPFMNVLNVNADTMTFCQKQRALDIETYGLFAFEDLEHLVPVEIFYALQLQYLRIAIGKGMMTIDEMYALAFRFQDFFTSQ